ncbi:MAG TPA: hypothetical protein PKV72_00945 [Candidatus Peribacteria bacterium]|nr:hypothetical protein [Candidatus Peribacteria bacterium]
MAVRHPPSSATRVLHATELAVPYNNVSNLYVFNGERPNPRFGGDCLYQAYLFGERFRAAVSGVPVRFHNSEGEGTSGHIVPITGDEDERQAFEVTQLATQPIALADIRGRANEKKIRTFPLPPNGDRTLSCFWLPQMDQLNMSMISGCEGGLLHHRIATDSPIQLPGSSHPIDDTMVRMPRRPLRLHALDADFGKVAVTLDPVDDSMTVHIVGADTYHSGSRAFEDALRHVATVLGVQRAQLLEFFHEGGRMERKLQGL